MCVCVYVCVFVSGWVCVCLNLYVCLGICVCLGKFYHYYFLQFEYQAPGGVKAC